MSGELMMQCPECKGSGHVSDPAFPHREPEVCPRCAGASVVAIRSWVPRYRYETCADCGGVGHVGGRSELRNGDVVQVVNGDECVRCAGDGITATRV